MYYSLAVWDCKYSLRTWWQSTSSSTLHWYTVHSISIICWQLLSLSYNVYNRRYYYVLFPFQFLMFTSLRERCIVENALCMCSAYYGIVLQHLLHCIYLLNAHRGASSNTVIWRRWAAWGRSSIDYSAAAPQNTHTQHSCTSPNIM